MGRPAAGSVKFVSGCAGIRDSGIGWEAGKFVDGYDARNDGSHDAGRVGSWWGHDQEREPGDGAALRQR